MKKQWQSKVLVWLIMTCLMLGSTVGAVAGETSVSDFSALEPLMDVVAAAVMTATDEPEMVPGSGATLSNAFVEAFFRRGATQATAIGMTTDLLGSPEQQGAFLSQVFAAQSPSLQSITPDETPFYGYIGFMPMTVNNATEEGGIQIIGEVYWADQAIRNLSQAEYQQVQWQEKGIFTFQNDPSALNGFRLTGFSVGAELDMELQLKEYFEEILVEYVNTGLGFSLQYPSIFTDDLLVEDGDGVSATLPDGSASFFAKRVQNTSKANLEDYVGVIANGITGARAQINEQFEYATVSYTTEEGFSVFDVYIVTDRYIYQAELTYRTEQYSKYSIYNSYLENTFIVDEISVG